MATEENEGFKKHVSASRKMIVIRGTLFFTRNTEKDPSTVFPNKIMKNVITTKLYNFVYYIQQLYNSTIFQYWSRCYNGAEKLMQYKICEKQFYL